MSAHIVDQYLMQICQMGGQATASFGQMLQQNGAFVNTLRTENDQVANLFVQCGVNPQQAHNRVADTLAAGAFLKFVSSNNALRNMLNQHEMNFLNQAQNKVASLKNDIAQAKNRLGQSQQFNSPTGGNGFNWNNNGGVNNGGMSSADHPNISMGSSLLSAGMKVKEPEFVPFGADLGTTSSSIAMVDFSGQAIAEAAAKQESQQTANTAAVAKPTINLNETTAKGISYLHAVRIADKEDSFMKLNYAQHERNTEFFNQFTIYGKLVPEDHTRVLRGFLEGFEFNVNTLVTDEPVRYGYQENNVDITGKIPGFTLTQPTGISSLKDAIYGMTYSLASRLGDDAGDLSKTPVKGPICLASNFFVAESIADDMSSLIDSNNIIVMAQHLHDLYKVIPHNIWHAIDRELTRYVNNYLCSTLPVLIKISSFAEDAKDLYDYITANVAVESAEEEYGLHYRLTSDILKHLGKIAYMPANEMIRDVPVPEGEEPKYGLHQGALVIESLHYAAVTRFTAAELQIACPKIHDATIQPTGALVDKSTLPELHRLIELVLDDAAKFDLNEALLLTEDGYYLRASRALLMDGFVLDSPVAV